MRQKHAETYPEIPGYKSGAPDTSAHAAPSRSEAQTLRWMILSAFADSAWAQENTPAYSSFPKLGWTADEMAKYLGFSILSVRPRFSELRRLKHICDAGMRRHNLSGRMAVVWRLR